MPDFAWTTLITPAAAAAAAVFAVAGLRRWIGWPPGRLARPAVLAAATILLLGATMVVSGFAWPAVITAIPTGLTAGYAAIAVYDTATRGADYQAVPAKDYYAPVGPTE